MKSLILILISLAVLSSCEAGHLRQDNKNRITTLEYEVSILKSKNTNLNVENANLKVENDLLKAGGNPDSIETSTSSLVSSDPQFVEGSYAGCMKEAYDIYISQGSEYCKTKGYTPVDIAANKCQLEDGIMEQLKMTKSKAEGECDNLYK